MKSKLLESFEKRVFAKKKKYPDFRSGDTVRVHYKIQEGADKEKFRIQTYEGVVMRYRKGVADGSFTVRKISAGGVGVERCFPLFSPFIDRVDVVAKGMVRRSRLYYLRSLSGKSARIKSRFLGKISTDLLVAPEVSERDTALNAEVATTTDSSVSKV